MVMHLFILYLSVNILLTVTLSCFNLSLTMVKMVVPEREQRQRLRDLAIFYPINGNLVETLATLPVKKVRAQLNLNSQLNFQQLS